MTLLRSPGLLLSGRWGPKDCLILCDFCVISESSFTSHTPPSLTPTFTHTLVCFPCAETQPTQMIWNSAEAFEEAPCTFLSSLLICPAVSSLIRNPGLDLCPSGSGSVSGHAHWALLCSLSLTVCSGDFGMSWGSPSLILASQHLLVRSAGCSVFF